MPESHVVDGSSNSQGESRSPGYTMEIPASLFRNRRLSIGARMLMCYLTSLPREADGAVLTYVPGIGDMLGAPAEDVGRWLRELDEHDYIAIVDVDSTSGRPRSIRFGWDASEDAGDRAQEEPQEETRDIDGCPLLKCLLCILRGRPATDQEEGRDVHHD